MLLSVCSSHCKSDHRAAAGQQHRGWLHFHLILSIPTSPLNLLFRILLLVLGVYSPPQHKLKRLNLNRYFVSLSTSYLFSKWAQFFVCKTVEATIFHSRQWNPGDNQYDMPNNRTQWFEFNTLGSRITNVPVAENRSPPHRSSSNWNAQRDEEWKYIKHIRR